MNLKVELKDNKAELLIELSAEELAPHLEAAIKNKINTIEVDGFRKGKMPKAMFLQKYGMQSVYPETIDIVINAVYPKMIMENEVAVIAAPEFNWAELKIDEKDGFTVTGSVDVMPEFEVTVYKEVKDSVEKEVVKVTKKEVEQKIKELVDHKATIEIKEEAAEDGDITVIDFEGFVDGEAFEGGKGEDYPLTLGSNSFIPGFEEQLIGAKAGEEVEVKVTFPANYQAAHLADKEAVFKCTVKEVKTKKAVRLTKEIISEIKPYEVTTKAELVETVEAELTTQREEAAKNKYQNEIIEKIIENAGVVAPDSMIKQETDYTLENFKNQISQQGIEFDMYIQMMGTTVEALREDINKESKRKIEEMLVLEAIVKTEAIEISEEEVNAKVKELSETANMSEEDVLKEIGSTERLTRDMKFDKAYKLILGE